MYLPQQPRRYSTNVIQFSEFVDQKVQERFSNLEVEAEEQADLADPAIEAEETRPFDKALTAIEANAWLEFCIWLVTISIEAYSALRFVLEEYQLLDRAKKFFLQCASELGKLSKPIRSSRSSWRAVLDK